MIILLYKLVVVSCTNRLSIIVSFVLLGAIISASVPLLASAQSGVNWLQICKNPAVDAMITEPCSTLATPNGVLTSEGHKVLGCIGGGALAVATGNLELLTLAPAVGCGGNSSSFASGSGNNDVIGNIIGGLFR
jgi:hypothetical protein